MGLVTEGARKNGGFEEEDCEYFYDYGEEERERGWKLM